MKKIATFEYILSLILYLLYIVLSWKFFIYDDIHSGIASIIFLTSMFELRRIRGNK